MKKEKSGFALLMQWAGEDRKFIYASIFLALISSVCGIVPYLLFYRIIDRLVDGNMTSDYALKLAGILLLVTLVRVACNLGASLSSHRGAYNTLFKVRCKVTEHMAHMPLGALNERNTGEIKYIMNESIEKMELFLAHNLPELVLYMSGPIVMFIYLLTVNVKLGFISIIPLVPVIIVMIMMFMRFAKFMDAVNSSSGELSGSVGEYVNGMRVIRAYNMSVRSFRKYSEAIDSQHKLWCDISKATGPFYAAYIVLLECGILMLVPAGGYMYVNGHITAGVLLLFAFIGTQYLTDIRPLQELSNNLSFVLNGVNQVKGILDSPIFEGEKDFPEKHDIVLRNVSFKYGNEDNKKENTPNSKESDSEKYVLSNVNLEIKDGERVAVIGESGAGKSTLVQLISRFYDVSSGEVLIGGVNIRDINYDRLLENISVVFQNSFLTRGSIYENIAMGSNASLESVRAAAKAAQIDDFIMSLPEGYDTLTGSYGGRFSGGEKQRICIARAILKNSPILILDEATSAADPENQMEIDKAIDNLCEGKTVIIVAHRLSVVKKCDRIAVVENQGVSDIGSFEYMIENNSYFKEAWKAYNEARNTKYQVGGENE